MPELVINLGGLVMAGTRDAFPSSLPVRGWIASALTDWYSLSDNKVCAEEKPQGHGAFSRQRSWRKSLPISFKAWFVGDSNEDVIRAAERIASIGVSGPVRMVVTDSVRTTYRMVSVEHVPVPDNHGRAVLSFDVDCLADDPVRYALPDSGESVSASTGLPSRGGGLRWPLKWPLMWGAAGSDGRVIVFNAGKRPAYVTYTVSGAITAGFSVTQVETGAMVALNRDVPDGSSVVFDSRAHSVTFNGQSDVSRYLTASGWGVVPPESSATFQLSGTALSGSAPRLTVSLSPGW